LKRKAYFEMEQQKLIKGGIAYFIDFRGKIKCGCIYWEKEEKIGVMGIGILPKDVLFSSRKAAQDFIKRKAREAKVIESKTFEIQFIPCTECKHYDADLCDTFCITKTIDERYYHELFKKKRKPKDG
jgi:hypothetical protein